MCIFTINSFCFLLYLLFIRESGNGADDVRDLKSEEITHHTTFKIKKEEGASARYLTTMSFYEDELQGPDLSHPDSLIRLVSTVTRMQW